ncbi:3-oxoacyl-[acyl-carrier-protein] reductase [Capsaspora owczarzaki ATCC 30864]|uniref:3-oxoacyl-[acyl-carrier-protein] reductase n=1 Tax=Capsaspora owczarzaki (strain ATCC 30864) TaxID=595528 RepID=A0A0D2WUQ9_CAPO3|nr:3-oxoacyl-[acyl-carrier-protein] reductase [Capsaspora owczarzaki ATCC 30864]KJE96445.1 3-oxoacyl-[acyl-carrier-protein] reductase [Capsaspora owczarzaki ATCC 30864]|eukprot:XP_004344391.1 3-oxoacyl-[acyl-carrier-protein] reductase [Capsaspora owczarzaki ATCC 30864]
MHLRLDGKLVLVTASTGGIGEAIATSLAREGARVIVNGRSQASVDAAIARIRVAVPGALLEPLAADNGTAEGNAATVRHFPDVDILVNNLGIFNAVPFFELSDAEWTDMFQVNVMSGVRLSRHYLKRMIARNEGRVLFVSSESGVSPDPDMAHYSATKTTQLSLSRSLAQLTQGTNVSVNTVLPGPTRTDGVVQLVKNLFPDVPYAEAERKFMHENRPNSLIARLMAPEEIADAVTFLASPLSSAINGAAIRLDGGLVRTIV